LFKERAGVPKYDVSARFGVEREFGFIPRFAVVGTNVIHDRLLGAIGAAQSVSLDFPALNVFFRTGMFLDGATPFREIRRLVPPPVLVPPARISRESAIEAYIDLFRQAVRRRAPPASALALSGGCDSRHILLELHRQKRLPRYALTVIMPGRRSEVRIAQHLAGRIGLQHVVRVPEPGRAVADELWKNEACGFMSLEHGWFANVGRERDSLPWWDGIAGDVLSAGLCLEEWNLELFRNNRLDELADRLVSDRPVPYFRDQSMFVRADAVAAVRAELSKHAAAPNPVGSFYFWNRTRVAIAASAFGLLRPAGQTNLAPYLDRDLWAFLASLPAGFFLDHRFHRDAVSRAYPEFADVPYFEEKDKVRPDASAQRMQLWRLLLYLGTARKDLDVLGMVLRTARALLDPRRVSDVDWLLPFSAYCTQIRRIAARS
jgi:asparagine synthase (glutamine-hydrolysing)